MTAMDTAPGTGRLPRQIPCITGPEFAYSQVPRAMKGSLMSFWTLAVTVAISGCCWPTPASVTPP